MRQRRVLRKCSLFACLCLAMSAGCDHSPTGPRQGVTGVWEGALILNSVGSLDPCILESISRQLPASYPVSLALEQDATRITGNLVYPLTGDVRLLLGVTSGAGVSLVLTGGEDCWRGACHDGSSFEVCLSGGSYGFLVDGDSLRGTAAEEYADGRATIYGSLNLRWAGDTASVGFTPE